MNIKIKKLQLIRHLTQLISFFLLPGFFILVFGELKYFYQSLISGNVDPAKLVPASVELILAFLFTAVLGRFFCGWICAFGTYNDLIYSISKNIFKTRFKISSQLDSALKYLKYVVLLVIIAFSWTTSFSFFEYGSPWEAFAQITDIKLVISSLALGLFILLLISVGSFFIERFFCRYLCPLGAIFGVLSKFSIFGIDMPKSSCIGKGSCRSCTRSCSMGISLYGKDEVHGGECINCFSCVEACPSSNAKPSILNIRIPAAIAVSIVLTAVIGFYALGNIGTTTNTSASSKTAASYTVNSNNSSTTTTTTSQSNSSTSSSKSTSSKYKDGTYTGSGIGFRGGTTTLSVTISNDKIVSVSTISSDDTPRFYDRAELDIFNEIISAQSSSVDTVSGATYSSNGIMSAVQNALDQAAAAAGSN